MQRWTGRRGRWLAVLATLLGWASLASPSSARPWRSLLEWFEATGGTVPFGGDGPVEGGRDTPTLWSKGLILFPDLPTFEASFPGLPLEDFEESPVLFLQGCDEPLDAMTNDPPCFLAGEILPGVALQTAEGLRSGCPADCPLVLVAPGLFSNPSIIVGPNALGDTLELVFDPPIEAFAATLFLAFSTDVVTVELFDVDDNVVAVLAAAASPTGEFLGVASDDPLIARATVAASLDGDIFLDDLRFPSVAATPSVLEVPAMTLPGALWLLAGLAALGVRRLRSRAAAS